MFSFLRSTSRATKSHRNTNLVNRLKKAWLKIDRLEQREVPATFTVTNLTDGFVTGAGQLPGSLRQAIFDANALAGADIIDMTGVSGTLAMTATGSAMLTAAIPDAFANSCVVDSSAGIVNGTLLQIDSEFVLVTSVSGTTLSIVRGQNGSTATGHSTGTPVTSFLEYLVTDDVTFNGSGATNLTINAGGSRRHFTIGDGTSKVLNVAMTNFKLTNGFSTSGGAIRVGSESLSLSGMVLTKNKTGGNFFHGGAIAGDAGTIIDVNNSALTNNTATGDGGAIQFGFPATAGPYNQLRINNSALTGNTSTGRGGAVNISHATGQLGGVLNIQNTTIANNRALGDIGGGVYIAGTPSSMTLFNSTVVNNQSFVVPGGGGLAFSTGTSTMYIVNSIVANNGNIATAPDIYTNSNLKLVTINSVIGSTTGISGTGFVNVSGNVIGPASLALLANNGGPTQTVMPLPGVNPAVDAGISSYQFTTLSAPALVGDTTLKVTANTNLAVGAFIKIDSEVMRISAISSSTVTVNRAQEGTTAAAHANAAGVLLNFGLTVNDQRGAGFARVQGAKVDIGAVEVNPTAPWAVASASNVLTAGGTSVTVNVVYTAVAPASVDTLTIDTNDIRLIGPGYATPAIPNATPIITGSGGSVTVTYTFDAPPAPGGAWDYTDNGLYTVVLQPGQVTDSTATPIVTDNIGQFTSAIPRTIVVTTAADSGPGSLRDAIEQANQNASVTDSITFDTIAMGTSVIPVSSQMTITDSVVINQGGPAITLDGQNTTRLLFVGGLGTLNINISKTTFTQGFVFGTGAGILFENENLTLTDCLFTANKADGGGFNNAKGAAISGQGINNGALTLIRCTFDNNITTNGAVLSNGGAVFLGGDNFSVGALYDLTVVDSTFVNNKAWVNGGAIHMGDGSLNISNSTFVNNEAGSRGGAIRMSGTVNANGFSIRNTTISGNTAGTGGGAYLYLSSGKNSRFLIANSTIVNNKAVAGAGGGILAKSSYNYQVDFENSIISSNTASTVAPNLAISTSAVANNSFVSIYDAATAKLVGFNNQLGTKLAPLDPLLAPLALNGGTTLNHRPYGGSPVIDTALVTPTITTVTTAMLSTGTTMVVASNTNLAVNMLIQVDSEIMQVQAISGTNITVGRGWAGTSGAAHAVNAVVTTPYAQPADDQRGPGFPRVLNGKVDSGSIETDPNIPSAKLTAPIPLISSPTANPVQFQVTFADNVAIDATTLYNTMTMMGNNNAIRVVNVATGFNQLATFVGPPVLANGTPINVTFEIAAPGGSWDLDGSENGVYEIYVEPMQVADTSMNFVEGHLLGSFRVSFGTTYIVTNDNDSGMGSLRDALTKANNNVPATDTITFSSFFNTPRTITFDLGEIVMTDSVVISGPGAKFVTLKGANTRLFTVDTPSNLATFAMSGLTLTGGTGTGGKVNGIDVNGGGAILLVDELLTIDNCVITGNTATGTTSTNGGGIFVYSILGALTVTNSTISNNTAGGSGGGIQISNGVLNIANSTISGNAAGVFGNGGGLDVTTQFITGFPMAVVNIEGSTFANNFAGSSGGGIRIGGGNGSSRVPTINVTNTTISGNVTNGSGGGISLASYDNLSIRNSTITGNSARVNGGGIAGNNFISTSAGSAPWSIINSIVAGNKNKINPDISVGSPTITATTTIPVVNSFIGAVNTTNTKINLINSVAGTLAAPLDPLLGPLTNNGGLTATHLPALNSPVLNIGSATPVVPMTTLAAAVTSAGSTTISVANSAPVFVGLLFQIDSEIMKVSSISGTTVTVTRGEQSTTAATHSSGALLTRLPVALPSNDQRGAGFPRVQGGSLDLGAVEVNLALPQATGAFPAVTAPQAGNQTITITFRDDLGITATSIKNDNAIRVTGPGGVFNVLASYVPGSISVDSDGTPRTAQYNFTPPVNGASGWDYTDNGVYSVSIEPMQVTDTNGNFVAGGLINTLNVAIGRSFVVSNDMDQGTGSLRQAILDSNANAGFDTITFDSFFSSPRVIPVGLLGEMFITDPLTITGPGAANANIDGGTTHRIFNINLPPVHWGGAVNISGLTLSQGGGKNVTGTGGSGGAINNESAALNIDASVFSFNGNGSNSGGVLNINSIYAPLTFTNSSVDHTNAFSGQVFTNNSSNFLTGYYDELNVVIGNSTFTQNVSTAGSTSGGVINFSVGVSAVITNSEFTANAAGLTTGSGGVILAGTNTKFTISGSTFASNLAGPNGSGSGGAIAVNNTGAIVNISRSTFSGNAAGNATTTSGGSGGAIFVSGANTVTLDSSTLTGNLSNGSSTSTTSGIGGGGIYLTSTANVIITNSTLHNNTANLNGGGIQINSLTNSATPSLAGSLAIRNSTIAYNFATGNGGGINFRTSSSGTPNVSITSSIVSENSSPGVADLRSGTGNATTGFTVNNSFIGVLTGATITGANNKNTTADGSVNLSNTLALNGAAPGSPLTLAFLGASAAIDNGTNATPLNFDQRGTTFSRVVNFKSDMGAFEVQNVAALPTVVSIQVNDGMSVQRSMVQSMTITFSAPVSFPNGIGSAFSLIRTSAVDGGPLGSVLVTGSLSMGDTVATLTFLNGGAVTLDPAGSLPDGKYTLTLLSNQIAGPGGLLDGNMNGSYQGSPIDDVSSNFFRLFGDADGNGSVTALDFNAFRLAYGSVGPSIFDFNGDNQVTAIDFNSFRLRYGQSI